MKRILQSVFLFCMLYVGLMTNQALAVTAYPYPVDIIQPDGTTITVILKGDEKVKWAQTLDGYTILRNTKGVFEYAMQVNNDLTPSGIAVSDISARKVEELNFLSKTQKGIFYSKSQVSMMKSISAIKTAEVQKAFPTTGARKLVCILMGFTDKAFTKTQADFNNLYNQVGYSTGGATGSVKDFYNENSYGQFDLTVTVAGPYTAANNMAYYGANDASGNDVNPRALVSEAINKADATVNFADFDNDGDGTVDGVYIIYAGYGEEAGASTNAIWAHAWSLATPVTKDGKSISKYSCSAELSGSSGTTMTAIGVICHEFGHVLGSPDYYDVDYTTGGQFDGTGDWDLMASGSWNNNGITPASHNAYTKVYVYGWATATTLAAATTVTVSNAETNQSFYRINSTTTNEFWLMENRQQVGFDAYLPGHGLIIYHAHSGLAAAITSGNINASYPQKFYPVCANATSNPGSTAATYGTINGAGCPFPGSGAKTSFTDATTPWMKSWAGALTAKPITAIVENTTAKTITFTFMGGSVTPTAPTATTLAASGVSTSGATLNASVNANNATTTVTFEYGTTTSYGTTVNGTPNTVNGATATSITAALTGLTASTTYNYRAKAVNSVGTTYGSNMTFTATANPTSLNLPVAENFATSTLPAGWSTQNVGTGITERWGMSNTANAGGAAYELKCSYQNLSPATTRVITPAINTVGISQVTFSFKHMLDAYATGVTLRVQTSNDKTTWTNTSWSAATTATNIAAATVNVTVTTNLNSAATYFALVADGNLYQIDYWYIDNISITSGSSTTTPTVTTTAASGITASSATAGGNVTADGGATVTERGICYATTANPTTANTKVTSGTGTGTFTANMTSLAASTLYYVRAYAINSNGTTYGAQVSFTTLTSGGGGGTVIIGDGTSTQGYPINCYYGYERSASIYTAAEVGVVGSLTMVEWYPTLTTSYSVPVKIYIKHTSASTITAATWANSISGATLVYSGTMAGTTANTWKAFTLSTPFNFTGGTNNLMVLVETNYGGTGAGSSTGPAVRYTSATSKHMYVRADNTAPTTTGTVTSYRPNIRLTIAGSPAPQATFENNFSIISAYPNPTRGLITIQSEGGIQSINVYSITGAKIYSRPNITDQTSKEIDLSAFNSGIYIIVVNDGIKNHTLKVIKE